MDMDIKGHMMFDSSIKYTQKDWDDCSDNHQHGYWNGSRISWGFYNRNYRNGSSCGSPNFTMGRTTAGPRTHRYDGFRATNNHLPMGPH